MKRIITCSDGTWNKPNTTSENKYVHTNVQKIFDLISHRDENHIAQIKCYDEGIGARGNFITRLFNGATGKGIDENIQDVYKFIVWNYQEDDELFLFGFSRGAYTARSLAGLIRKCGIIKRNDLDLIADAYALYRDKSVGPNDEAAKAFRKMNCYTTDRIKFIGVWDTVGSLGIPLHAFQWWNKMKYSFYDTNLSSIVDYAYHALAIDEKRGNFEPTLWHESDNLAKRIDKQILEQRWFTGVHSNVGGGYPEEDLSDITLRWMIEKAQAAGLGFYQHLVDNIVKPNEKGKLYDSRSGFYKLLPKYIRPVCKGDDTHESIDPSVWLRYKETGDELPSNLKGLMPKE